MADSDVAVSVGDQLPMLLKNSAYTVDANLQKHTRAPPRTRSGRFQSMLSVRRATAQGAKINDILRISIHALRKESDNLRMRLRRQLLISIHALRKESDLRSATELPKLDIFQSTLSVRRATALTVPVFGVSVFQSTLSVRRATSPK